jgi:hypothetical protein
MARVKGAHVINAVKVLRSSRERARAALPPRLHKYLEERILPSTWYPFEDHIELLRAIAAILEAPDPWAEMGRGTARMDLMGIYRSHLRRGDVPTTLQAMGAMWKSAHDTGEVHLAVDGPGHATVRIRKFAPRSREICGITTGYLSETVFMACDKQPRVVHTECRVTGGVECIWSISWNG